MAQSLTAPQQPEEHADHTDHATAAYADAGAWTAREAPSTPLRPLRPLRTAAVTVATVATVATRAADVEEAELIAQQAAQIAAQATPQPPTPTPPRKRTRWPDDIDVIFEKDPAACNILEVLLYQGLHAILLHRVAHALYKAHIPVIPRLISQVARIVTAGIEIHPGAQIGKRFFIDHGTGVVIGETAEIGDNVMLYHQVTLGATGWWKHRGDGRVKRHPTVQDNVTIGVGASVLGPLTVGHDSKIGAMALVLESLPPHSIVMAQPAKLQVSRHAAKDLTAQWDDDTVDYQI